MERLLWSLLALAATLAVARGQSILPSNDTLPDAAGSSGNESALTLSVSVDTSMKPIAPLMPLSIVAENTLPSGGLYGLTFLANASSEVRVGSSDIAFISCDPSPGNIQPPDVFSSAETNNAAAVIFYTAQSEWCNLTDYEGSYPWIYTMKSRNETMAMLVAIQTPDEARNGQVYATITPPASDNQVVNATGSSGSNGTAGAQSGNSSNPLSGPSPSTAVAMVILYSITGIITALFLAIIITGAVRAHRHPERYGPRDILGRPRQSRARGLARAMLDTLPIVKFGEREEPKPTELELGEGARSAQTDTDQTLGVSGGIEAVDSNDDQHMSGARGFDGNTDSIKEGGISAALPSDRQPPVDARPNSQGCSICTEDFEAGQDIRVLPCDHRFHPACIDPWLLNVSGTCPLCRHDLRPEHEREDSSEHERELDEYGNPVLREGQADAEMAPPLASMDGVGGSSERASIRRSITLGIMNIGRPDRASREERMLALRHLRGQRLARRRREEEAAVAETAEEQSRTGRLLRNLLSRNSRRTDGRDQVPSTPSAPQQTTQQPDETRASEDERVARSDSQTRD